VGSFAAAVERMAAGLHGQGIGQGDRVAWLGFNHPGQLVLLWALARLGAVFVPLNHRLSPAEWAAVLADCSPRLLVHDAAWGEQARALGAWPGSMAHERVCAVDALARVSAEPAPAHPDDATQPLLLVYTSGTTGHPKAAVHTQANLLANMAIAGQVQALSEQDVVLTVLPLFHVGGLCIQTLPALAAGAQVLLMARFDPGATLASIVQDRPTLTLQVPATLQALVSHPAWSTADVSSLRAVWAGSSVLPPARSSLSGPGCAGLQCVRQHRDRAVFGGAAAGVCGQPSRFLRLAASPFWQYVPTRSITGLPCAISMGTAARI